MEKWNYSICIYVHIFCPENIYIDSCHVAGTILKAKEYDVFT